MGETSSKSGESSSKKTETAAKSVSSLVNKATTRMYVLESVASEIKIVVGNDRQNMDLLVQAIVAKGISSCPEEISRLAKYLADFSCISNDGKSATFKEILLNYIEQTFLCHNAYPLGILFVQFLDKLFVADLIPPMTIKRWIEMLKFAADKVNLLRHIADKIMEEFGKPGHCSSINELRHFIIVGFEDLELSKNPEEYLDQIVTKLRWLSEGVVAAEIKAYVASNELLIKNLAEIFLKRSTDEESMKLATLAKLLSEVSCIVPETGFRTTFKDVLMSLVLKQLNSRNSDEFIIFLGNLYIADFNSASMTMHFLTLLQDQRHDQTILLRNIEDKVREEHRKPSCDSSVIRLKAMLDAFHISEEPLQSQSQSTPQCQQQNYPTNHSNSSSNDYDSDESSEEIDNAKTRALPQIFQTYLQGIQFPYDNSILSRLKTCSATERSECAKLMLETLIETPKFTLEFAKLTRHIQCALSPENLSHPRFSQHLVEMCEQKTRFLLQGKSIQWQIIKTIGVFLGHFYCLECLKNNSMNSWLESIQSYVEDKNFKATTTYLDVLKIVLNNMKSRDQSNFKIHVLQLQKLTVSGRVPPQYHDWRRNILSTNWSIVQEKIASVSASSSSINSTASFPQPSTGAIPKTSPTQCQTLLTNDNVLKNNPRIMEQLNKVLVSLAINSATNICSKLSALKVPSSVENSRKITNTVVTFAKEKPELFDKACEVLLKIPSCLNPALDVSTFKNQLTLSLISQLTFLHKNKKLLDIKHADKLIDFMGALYGSSAIAKENVAQILETLAIEAQNDQAASFQLLFLILMKLRDILGVSGPLKQTKASLLYLKNNSRFEPTKRSAAELLALINRRNDQEIPKIVPPAQKSVRQQSTSSATIQNISKENIAAFLEKLSSKSLGDIEELALQIKEKNQLQEFALAFRKNALQAVDCSQLVRLAQLFEDLLQSRDQGVPSLFKTTIAGFRLYCKSMTEKEIKDSDIAKRELRFIGELYKLGWINVDELDETLDMLCSGKELVCLFNSLLKQVAMKIVTSGDKIKNEKYREIFMTRSNAYKSSVWDHLACSEILKTFDEIDATEKVFVEPKPDPTPVRQEIATADEINVPSILENLSEENLIVSTGKLKHFVKQSDENSGEVVSAIWNQVLEKSGNAKLYSDLCRSISRKSTDSFNLFLNGCAEAFNGCAEAFFRTQHLKGENLCEEEKILLTRITIFIAELYASGFVKETVIENLLHSSKHLSFNDVVILSSIITSKINLSGNDNLKRLLNNLEETAHSKSVAFLTELKKDLEELRQA